MLRHDSARPSQAGRVRRVPKSAGHPDDGKTLETRGAKKERMLALKIFRFTAAIAICMAVLCPCSADAQVLYGSILGSLQRSRLGRANASVTITNKQTGQTREAVSDAQGNFNISNVLPGRYDVASPLRAFARSRSRMWTCPQATSPASN